MLLLALTVLIVVLPFWLCPNAELGGTDNAIKTAVEQSRQDYRSWARAFMEAAINLDRKPAVCAF